MNATRQLKIQLLKVMPGRIYLGDREARTMGSH